MTTTPCRESVSLGAYLLGALDPGDRRALETHIADCAHCREELLQLAPLPGLLRHTPFEELPESAAAAESLTPVLQQEPPQELPGQHRGRSRPRGRRLAAAGLALAAAVAGVLVYAGSMHDRTPSVAAAAETWSATSASTGVSATAALTPEAWGTEFQLKLGGLPSGITCHLVVHGSDGRSETAGTWGSGYATSASVPASTSISPSQISELDIVSGTGTVLVTVAPR
jgi:hypothetical protein